MLFGRTDADALARALLPAVLEAGRLEMMHFGAGVVSEVKFDRSPVTVADREAEAIIVAALLRIAPQIPIVAEEAMSAGGVAPEAAKFFLVDALDGTRLFIKGKPEFTVNIALIDHTRPVFGLIYAPATGALFFTRGDGSACRVALAPDSDEADFDRLRFKRLTTRPYDLDSLVAFNSVTAGAASRALLEDLKVKHARPLGSSLKFCLIAAGEGDLYARFGDTNEWDTAAGQAILEAAGGSVTTLDGHVLTYGHASRRYLNPHFIAWGGAPLRTQTIVAPLPGGGA